MREGFQSCHRRKGRKILFNDITAVIKNYSELKPQDIVFTLNMCKHKIIEEFEEELK